MTEQCYLCCQRDGSVWTEGGYYVCQQCAAVLPLDVEDYETATEEIERDTAGSEKGE